MLRRFVIASCLPVLVGLAWACGGKVDTGAGPSSATPDSGITIGPDAGLHPRDGGLTVIDAPISVLDSTVPFDGPGFPDVVPSDVFDDFGGFDIGAPDGGSTCSANTPFTPITWAPPTALHQAACTPTEIQTFANALQGTSMTFSSGNARCDACLLTDQTAPAHGPIVTVSMGGMEVPAELNFGGCIADFDGMKTSTGCGAILNSENDCANQECSMCVDFGAQQPGGPTAQCEQVVFEAGGPCDKFVPSPACQAEVSADGGISVCVDFSAPNSLDQFFTLWCGN